MVFLAYVEITSFSLVKRVDIYYAYYQLHFAQEVFIKLGHSYTANIVSKDKQSRQNGSTWSHLNFCPFISELAIMVHENLHIQNGCQNTTWTKIALKAHLNSLFNVEKRCYSRE